VVATRLVLAPPAHGLLARLDTKTPEDLPDVPLHAVERQAKPLSDFSIGMAPRDELKDLALARS
jgi:hypothetical protein